MNKNELKLEIMEATRLQALTLFEISPLIANVDVKASQIATVVDELVRDSFLTKETSPTVGTLYKHTTEHSLSDLRARLLPSRDPVREAHARDTEQGGPARYRRPTAQGADLDNDD